MKKDLGFMHLSSSDKEEMKNIINFIRRVGCNLINLEEDLKKMTQEYANSSKRPLLVFILGTSVLNQNHFDQIQNVLKDNQFDSLDLLLQIVAGDGTLAYEIVNFIRSKVAGDVRCIAPALLSGPGTLIAIGSDHVLGLDDTCFAPLDIPHLHPALFAWYIAKKEHHPEFYKNIEEIGAASYPQNIEYAKKLLANSESEKLVNYLTSRPEAKMADFKLSKLVEAGLKANIPSGEDFLRIRVMQGIIRGALGDFIYLIQ